MKEKLRSLRLENGLTQKELAAKIKSTDKNIWAYEKGLATPPIEIISAYADFFEVSVDYLLGRTDDLGTPVPGSVPQYSAEEQKLIEDYRGLSQPLKEMLQSLIKTWQGQNLQSQKVQSTRK